MDETVDVLFHRLRLKLVKDGSSSSFACSPSSSAKMTFKSLMNFGDLTKTSYYPMVERYSGGYHHGGYHHSSRGSYKSKGGANAALSALALLAFLFLINVMQQSMQDNNSMQPTTMATLLLRDNDQPTVLDGKTEDVQKSNGERHEASRYGAGTKSKIQSVNSQYIK